MEVITPDSNWVCNNTTRTDINVDTGGDGQADRMRDRSEAIKSYWGFRG